MNFKIAHVNINVKDVNESIAFYNKTLGLTEKSRIEREHFLIVYLGDEHSDFLIELTQLFDHPQAYELGENEMHIAFVTPNYDEAYKMHKEMGYICFENKDMGIYFIEDPDGYWLEIIPERK